MPKLRTLIIAGGLLVTAFIFRDQLLRFKVKEALAALPLPGKGKTGAFVPPENAPGGPTVVDPGRETQ